MGAANSILAWAVWYTGLAGRTRSAVKINTVHFALLQIGPRSSLRFFGQPETNRKVLNGFAGQPSRWPANDAEAPHQLRLFPSPVEAGAEVVALV